MTGIYDAIGRLKGYKSDDGDRVTYLSANGAIVGWYVPSADETYSADGSRLGKGDMGACLL